MAVSEGMGKLLYVVVMEDDDDPAEDVKRSETSSSSSFRYTRSVLQSTLQLMGCKPRHAFKISQRVFEMLRLGSSVSACEGVPQYNAKVHHLIDAESHFNDRSDKANVDRVSLAEDEDKSQTFELYKRRTTVVVRRTYFLDVVCEALSEYKYVGPNQRADLVLACRIRERKESVIVLLCGTSGCGKSTLSALLGSRLGITTIVSTDSIRHMMRSFVDEKENPLLWASTYHAGEHLDPSVVAQAKAKRQQMKKSSASKNDEEESATGKSETNSTARTDVIISQKQMAIEGYKAQSEMVIDSLDRLITSWEERRESVVMEGVHLSLNFVTRLMKKHPSIVPFMIYISNEEKHLERFAVRAKYMTLDPAKNKYVKYIRNIRTIQEYLINRADKHLVPKINNTNVDKSVAVIHATVFSCLRRRILGKQRLYDPITSTLTVVDEEYRNQRAAYSASSKGMLQLIQRKGSTRHLMALLNNDGSVAKAWPVDMTKESGKPMYDGPLQIDKAEPINLQFGHFGISAWLSDNGGTSRASSLDDSRGELMDNGSRYFSSCASSPKGTAEEIRGEEESEDGSDEEVTEEDSDEELSDTQKHLQEELEGSVDEEFTEFDEEQDYLAVLDRQDSSYVSDEGDAEFKMEMNDALRASQDRFGQQQILGRQTMSGSFNFSIPLAEGGDEKYEIRRRSHSITSLGSILWPQTGQEVLPR